MRKAGIALVALAVLGWLFWRTVQSSLAEPYVIDTGLVSEWTLALRGPLHGGANAEVMKLLLALGEDADDGSVEKVVRGMLADGRKVPGFGHRVYRTEDPRATHLRQMSQQLGERTGRTRWFAISRRIEEIMRAAKGLDANVDFYSASTYHLLGIPIELFTPIFAVSRVAGWTAHVLEQYANNRLIRPRAEYVGPEYPQVHVPLAER